MTRTPIPPRRVKGSRGPRAAAPALAVAEAGERVVPDPLQPGAVLKARVSLEHPIDMMFARGRLTPAQYEAAVRFRALYERAQIGAARGVDFARLRVDGGAGAPDALTQSVVDAHKGLTLVWRVLGKVLGRIVEMVCGQGINVEVVAAGWPVDGNVRARRDFVSMGLRQALDQLGAELWGATGPERAKVVGDGPRRASADFDLSAEDDVATRQRIVEWLEKAERRRAERRASVVVEAFVSHVSKRG